MIGAFSTGYRYVYFHLFLIWQTKLYESGNSKLNAAFTLSLGTMFYILGMGQLLESYDLAFWLNSWYISNEMLIMIAVFTLFNMLNWYFLVRNEEHDNIAKQFATATAAERKRGMVAAGTLFFSALLFHFWVFST